MGLGHYKSFLLFIGQNWKLYSFLPVSSFLCVVCYHHCHCGCWALVSQYFFRFLQVVKIVQVNTYYILPWFSILISLFCFLKSIFRLFCSAVLDENSRWLDFLHQRSGLLKNLQVQVKRSGLLEWFSFFVQLGSFKVLFKVLTDYSNVSEKLFVFDLSGNIETSLDVTELDAGSGDTSKALNIVPLNDRFLNSFKVWVDDWLFELFQGFCILALGLSLDGKPLADKWVLFRSDVFSQRAGYKPVLNIASHVESVEGFWRFEIILLS